MQCFTTLCSLILIFFFSPPLYSSQAIFVPTGDRFLESMSISSQVQLTHSPHEITSCLTSLRLVDCTVKETCRKGGHFRETLL